MDNTDRFPLSTLKPESISDVMALVVESGWNQIEADWELMCRAGDAIVARDSNGKIVASALALPYRPGFGWISMVLVAKAMLRRGLATRLLADRVSWLQRNKLIPVLDATEQGEPVYARSGFMRGDSYIRWQGSGGHVDVSRTRPAEHTDHQRIRLLDADVFGADRGHIIKDFLERPGSKVLVSTEPGPGFVILRKGRRATQIGPLVACDEAQAIRLLDSSLAAADGPVFFDALEKRSALEEHILSRGFEKQRGFVRMTLGGALDFDVVGRSMIIAGPEYG